MMVYSALTVYMNSGFINTKNSKSKRHITSNKITQIVENYNFFWNNRSFLLKCEPSHWKLIYHGRRFIYFNIFGLLFNGVVPSDILYNIYKYKLKTMRAFHSTSEIVPLT